ncbi:uncharacterized protein N7459_007960 [Penicillium hispanicum]|uniref:uncharacterized protein n=1 Tax=Penicillium hispanicum TaxID=1080232 RepID=UPI0025417089|nr:uncharacterized protein N7459_007960 [Penicillium hispanicum]KAJ5573533.1 hypothetical protein N7459_007960 [Penicillium hispanicum]
MYLTTPLLALSALIASTAALPRTKQSPSDYVFPEHCNPDPCAGITSQNDTYVCGDPRLGPVQTPKNFPLNNELRTYERFGSLCPAEFLSKWAESLDAGASYKYPPSDGFVVADDGNKLLGNTTLPVGQKLDRFGSEYGSFLAPLGAPYIERSLPPSNLDTYDGDYPFNYYVYEVTKSFVVGLGPIAPWFEQPGMGTQFLAYSSVQELLKGGFLRRLTPEGYDEPDEFADDYTPGPTSS